MRRRTFLDLLRGADAEKQIRQGKAGRILHAFLLRTGIAEIHLLHFAFEDLRQENCRIIAFANVAQHLCKIRPRIAGNIQPRTSGSTFCADCASAQSYDKNRSARFAGQFTEAIDHSRGDRAGFAGSDHASIRLDHRNQFGRRAGEKTFIRNKDIVTRDIGLRDLEAKFRRDIENDGAGDPPQRSRANRWSENLPALDDENVVRRAFGHVARFVQHQTLHRRQPGSLQCAPSRCSDS